MKREAQAKPGQAAQVAEQLLERTRPLLIAVDDLLPSGDPQRADLLNAVAHAADDAASIKADSLTHDIKRDWVAIQQLFERISRYAATPVMRARLSERLARVQNNVRASVYKTCWFCEEHEEAPGSSVILRMYHEVEYRRFEYYDLKIPRCGDCEKAHQRVARVTLAGVLAGIAAGLFLYWGVVQISSPDIDWSGMLWPLFGLPIVFAVLGGMVGHKGAWKSVSEKIKPEKHKMSFPDVKELFSKGWTNNKPS